ncbi:hypothetical protein [Paenibacillus naphthalenovorans]|uniref:hypothetical protein n=1 Tax=Paenibacillus naphthalenovorans TaxID=162209 RepID=UPI000884A3A9|nr:hypothetical protein [Paenibacillus naphthalenovorans]SDI49101.1 hypothetical protein SAMN05421868_10721 [Paenibacillus naphthalenovorans]
MFGFFKSFALIAQFILSFATAIVAAIFIVPIAWLCAEGVSIFLFGPAWMWFIIMLIVALGTAVAKYEPQIRKMQMNFAAARQSFKSANSNK